MIEQVLVKEASTKLEVTNPVFKDSTQSIIVRENCVCSNCNPIFDTLSTQIIIKDGYKNITTEPAKFETVTEQVLAREAYEIYHVEPRTFKREIKILTTCPTYEDWTIISRDSACVSINPLKCIITKLDLFSEKVDTFFLHSGGNCRSRLLPMGANCIETEDVPAVYTSRDYDRVVTPATANEEDILPLYYSFQKIIIQNKQDIPDSCITYDYDTIKTRLLAKPSQVKTTEIPSQYESRSYEKLVKGSGLVETEYPEVRVGVNIKSLVQGKPPHSKEEVYCELIIDYYYDEIVSKLALSGYSIDNSQEKYDFPFWNAVIRFQQDHGLSIGRISEETLNKLGIYP